MGQGTERVISVPLPVQEPMAANDPPAPEAKAADWKDPPWLSWDEVPNDVHRVAALGPCSLKCSQGLLD